MKEIIVFFISGKEYGIEISGMQSLENYTEVVPFPGAPDCILGTVRIRNEVYPVYDIKAKYMLPATEITDKTKMVLLRTNVGTLACVVDDIGRVFRVDGEDIQPFPSVARSKDTEYIDFVARRDNDLIVVIDPNTLLTVEESEEVYKVDFSDGDKD